MYAMFSTFMAESGRIREMEREANQREAELLRRLPGYQGRMLLLDPHSGKVVSVVFVETEQAARATQRHPEYNSVRLSSLYAAGDVEEAVFEATYRTEGADWASGRWARMTSYHVQPGLLEERIRHSLEVMEAPARALADRVGGCVLIDRAAHLSTSISVWKSERAMQRSEEQVSFASARSHRRYAVGEVQQDDFQLAAAE